MPIKKNGKILLSQYELQPLFDSGAVLNGSNGGLLIGNSHSEGGIKVIRKDEDYLYELIAELEGWEYVMCGEATYWNMEYLKSINNKFSGTLSSFVEYEIPSYITIIDARPFLEEFKKNQKILVFDNYGHFIINKNSTKKYLEELDALNKKYIR